MEIEAQSAIFGHSEKPGRLRYVDRSATVQSLITLRDQIALDMEIEAQQ